MPLTNTLRDVKIQSADVPAYLLVHGEAFQVFSFENETESPPNAGKRRCSGRKREGKEMQKQPAAATHFSVSLFPVRAFSTSAISPFLHPVPSSSRYPRSGGSVLCMSLFVSHTESRGGGRWWWWSCPDGGGYGGGVVGSFVPIPFPISPFSPYGRARRAP